MVRTRLKKVLGVPVIAPVCFKRMLPGTPCFVYIPSHCFQELSCILHRIRGDTHQSTLGRTFNENAIAYRTPTNQLCATRAGLADAEPLSNAYQYDIE
jgi:hypothetical protein